MNHTTVEHHTDTHISHSQLSNTSLEECTREVTADDALGLLQEAPSVLSELERSAEAQIMLGTCSAKTPRQAADAARVAEPAFCSTLLQSTLRSLAAEPLIHLGSLLWVSLSPLSLCSLALSYDLLQLLSTLSVDFLYIVEDNECILGSPPGCLMVLT